MALVCVSLRCVVPDREVPRPGNTAVFLTILDEVALTKTCALIFPALLKTLHLGLSMGAFPAQSTMPSSIGLNSVFKYGEKVTHGFHKCPSQRELSNL